MSLRIIFILAVLFSGLISAQELISGEEPDTTLTKYNLTMFSRYSSPLYATPNFENNIITPDYSLFLKDLEHVPLSTQMRIELSKAEFYNALGMVPQFRNRNDLGVLGDILMYTNTAATIYLLYKHIEKYGLK